MASNKDEQKEAKPEPAPALAPEQEVKVPAPTKRHKPRAEIIFKKSRSSKNVVS
jgi:hypothetical protein